MYNPNRRSKCRKCRQHHDDDRKCRVKKCRRGASGKAGKRGDDGERGKKGKRGPEGPEGPPGPVVDIECGQIYVGSDGGEPVAFGPGQHGQILMVNLREEDCFKWVFPATVECPIAICDTDSDVLLTTKYNDQGPPKDSDTIGGLTNVGIIFHDNGGPIATMPAQVPDVPKLGKLMEYGSDKSALRGGNVTGTQWDYGNVGNNSFAWGDDVSAIGDDSASFGQDNAAQGLRSFVTGESNQVEGENSCGFGAGNLINPISINSSVFGINNEVTGAQIMVWGSGNEATGLYSTAWGSDTEASATGATVFGTLNKSSGDHSTSFGVANEATANGSTAWGVFNKATAINATAWGEQNVASGFNSTAWGVSNKAIGNFSTVMGFNNIASGVMSTLHGFNLSDNPDPLVPTNINILMAGKYGTWNASLPPSTATLPTVPVGGTTSILASDAFVHCGGTNNTSKITAPAYGVATVIGINLPGHAPRGVVATNVVTVIGADYGEYFEWVDGNVEEEDRVGYAVQYSKLNPGMIEIYHHSSSDDSDDSDDSDSGDNISDRQHMKKHVIGIVSGTAGVVGDNAPFMWHGTNDKDEFGRDIAHYSWKLPIMDALIMFINGGYKLLLESNGIYDFIKMFLEGLAEDEVLDDEDVHLYVLDEITTIYESVTIVNPPGMMLLPFIPELEYQLSGIMPILHSHVSDEFDHNEEYHSRDSRIEWEIIGMLGKIYLRDNGECVPGKRCDVTDGGIAIPGRTWYVLSRSGPNVIRIDFRSKS